MFDLTAYEQVRRKYSAEGAFPHLHDKVSLSIDGCIIWVRLLRLPLCESINGRGYKEKLKVVVPNPNFSQCYQRISKPPGLKVMKYRCMHF